MVHSILTRFPPSDLVAQEAVNKHIREIFGIKTGFKGDLTTKLASAVVSF